MTKTKPTVDLPIEGSAAVPRRLPEPGGPPRMEGPALVDGGRVRRQAAGADVVCSMAERAGATITELEGSHVIMVSQLEAVTNVIMEAVGAVAQVPVGA